MKKGLLFVVFILSAMLAGCDALLQVADQGQRPLTQQEVVRGLKQALVIGADSASRQLATTNGYFGDEAVRILLPPQADAITDNISRLPGGEQMVNDVLLRINRAAEHAAREAAPVFAGAIQNMSIRDGFDILRGESDAATQYLRQETGSALQALYQPHIARAMEQSLVGNVSTQYAWDGLTGQWNRLAESVGGRVAGLQPVEVDLAEYLTLQALDGLFLKLAEEEAKIRTDPAARVTDLLSRVFGQ